MILLLAVWMGLLAGFLDLGLFLVKQNLSGAGFAHVGDDYPWLIPAGVILLLVPPGLLFALLAMLRATPGFFGVAVGLLAFVGILDASARLPIAAWAGLLFSTGLALQCGRWAKVRPDAVIGFARRTAPALVATLLVVMLVTVGGRAWGRWRAIAALPAAARPARNVLLIVWDTVRADHLSLHGYGRRTSPHLERLASQGIRFDRAFSPAPWTLPAHSSLFTGRWPHELSADWLEPLDGTFPTLAEFLSSRGYDTAGFAANLDYATRETGLARGFAHYEDYPITLWEILTRYTALGTRVEWLTPASVLNRFVKTYFDERYDVVPHAKEHAKNGEMVDRSFFEWLNWQQRRERPFFAFLNFNDAHSPYEVADRRNAPFGMRPVSYMDRAILQSWDTVDKTTLPYPYIRLAIDLYDDAILYMDQRLGIVLQELDKRGLSDETLVIVLSDHGEHLGDHGLFSHGCSLYRQLLGVPLVILDPKAKSPGRVVTEPVSLRDIPATVVDLLGVADGSPFPGVSLAQTWRQTGENSRVEALVSTTSEPPGLSNQGREPVAKGPMASLVAEGLHYILRGDRVEEMYDIEKDPAERTDVVLYPHLLGALERFRAEVRRLGVRK
jgi:arylsulfatase A-like enzyme